MSAIWEFGLRQPQVDVRSAGASCPELPESAVWRRGAMKVVPARRWPARPWSGGRARIAAGCAAATALLLTGCQMPGSGSPGASEQVPAGSSITVAAVPGVGNAPLYVAQQQGLF